MAYLLGIDIGTSGTKTVLFHHEGKPVASCTLDYPMAQPHNGWAEQDPTDWWHAVVQGIRRVLADSGISAGQVRGIGLSGQMHGAVALDRNGQVLRPAILWCDQRTQEECRIITETVGRERLIHITANPALTGFTASKILWIRRHEPEIYQKIQKILLPKDYIRFRLTGEYATEVSDASGMQLLDVPGRRWSSELLDLLQIRAEWLAPVYESQEISSCVSVEAAGLTGLAPGTPVAGGAGDQAAGAVGNGIVRRGVVSSTIGTSGVVFAFSDHVTIDPLGRVHTFCHAVPGKWHVMGVTQAAGLSLQWFRNHFCGEEVEMAKKTGLDPYQVMDARAAQVPAGSDGLLYLPYLMGERTPHLDPDARGVFYGLSARHGRENLMRAVMEGVAYSLRDCLDIIRDMGIPADTLIASGGGGKSPLWRQMQADILSCDIVTLKTPEGPALGAAILAGVGTGVYASVEEACDHVLVRQAPQAPVPENQRVYERYYPVYRKLYLDLKDSFRLLEKARIMPLKEDS